MEQRHPAVLQATAQRERLPNEPGVVVTGRLDAVGNYTDLDTHTGFDYWHDIVPADTTTGRVLFYQSGALKTVGEVGTDGGYSDVKNSTDVPFPRGSSPRATAS